MYSYTLEEWLALHSTDGKFSPDGRLVLDFNYYKYEKNAKETDIKCGDLRWKFHHQILSDKEIDKKSTYTAFSANAIQCIDAFILREVTDAFICLTVHDCIIINIEDVPILIDNINKFMTIVCSLFCKI